MSSFSLSIYKENKGRNKALKTLGTSYQGDGWYSNFGKECSRSIFVSCYSNQSGLKFMSLRQSVPILVPLKFWRELWNSKEKKKKTQQLVHVN